MKNRLDPELEAQERGDWFTHLVLWLVAWLPLLPLVLFYVAQLILTIGIIIHYLIVPVF
jgi:hypothetical protein